jgi:hypothetical protein
MSRSNYSHDCENVGLYRGTVERAIAGPRVQALLRDMVSALESMPVRELAADVFVDGESMCAMGAVARARNIDEDTLARLDPHEPDDVGELLDIPACVAAEIAYENDEWARGDDEDRWQHMHAWALSKMRDDTPASRGHCSWCCKSFTLRDGLVNAHKHNGAPCDGVGKLPVDLPKVTS